MLENRHLQRWHAAGLINDTTRARILDWERTEVRPAWLWALAGIGGFAVLLGILALVAANWALIPGRLKIASHLLVDIAVSATLFLAWRSGRERWRELSALLLFGLVLTSIGLIGQTYQLDGTVSGAMLLWMALTTPFLAFFTRSGGLGLAWVGGYGAMCLVAAPDVLERVLGFTADWEAGIVPLAWVLILMLLAVGLLRGLFPATRRQGEWIEAAGCLALTVVASLPEVMLRLGGSVRVLQTGWPAVAGAGAILAALLVIDHQRHRRWNDLLLILPLAGLATWWLTVAAVTAFASPVPSGDLDEGLQLVVALIFVGFWAITGWLALRRGQRGLFLAAFVVITGRIFIFYWEAFGSLLSTGLGLILGGGLCLGLASLGWRLSRTASATPA